MQISDYKLVFIGGLQRSGTSLLFKCLRDHPAISGFRNTGVPEDEGQFLQNAYPTGRRHGGPGRFGFHPEAHLTEQSPLANRTNAAMLFSQWSSYWDLSKSVLVEKSPPNLIRTRFLKALFPDALFVMILRHPISVCYSTRKWRPRISLARLMEHWIRCHELLEADRPALGENLLVLRYERFAREPESGLARVFHFLGVDPIGPQRAIEPDRNGVYFEQWVDEPRDVRESIIAKYGAAIERFGYSLSAEGTRGRQTISRTGRNRIAAKTSEAEPDFIIAGTQKGGTTSLYRYLVGHPSVAPAVLKETHFFDTERFHEGPQWYRGCFWRKARRGGGTIVGEASPYYLSYPHAPERIARCFPNVRIIILLRNPVDRAFSHYHHEVRHGNETLSFEEAIAREPERIAGEAERMLREESYYSRGFRLYSYLTRGIYAEQITRWLDCFPREQILILESEDLFTNPASTFTRVLDFLGLPPWQPERFPRFHAGNYPNEMNPETRRHLEAHFRDHNRRLGEQLGLRFSWIGSGKVRDECT